MGRKIGECVWLHFSGLVQEWRIYGAFACFPLHLQGLQLSLFLLRVCEKKILSY